jgi:hypothetical protein
LIDIVPDLPGRENRCHHGRMTIRGSNAIVRFGLELCALAALAWWGVDLGRSGFGSTVLGIGFPTLAAVTWGNFLAPRAPQYLPYGGRVFLELLIFGTATLALAVTGLRVVAVVFGALAAANTLLAHVWRRDDVLHNQTAQIG